MSILQWLQVLYTISVCCAAGFTYEVARTSANPFPRGWALVLALLIGVTWPVSITLHVLDIFKDGE